MDRGEGHVIVVRAAARFFDGLSAGLNRIALWGAVLAVLVMAFAAGYQVVARYVFDAPPVWTEELARRAMVWAGMLGATVAFRERSDPTLFPEMLAIGGAMGKGLALVRAVGVGIFALPVLYYSLFGPNMNLARGFIGRSLDRKAEMMGISMAWFTVAVPLAFAIIMIHVLAALLMSLARGDEHNANLREESPA